MRTATVPSSPASSRSAATPWRRPARRRSHRARPCGSCSRARPRQGPRAGVHRPASSCRARSRRSSGSRSTRRSSRRSSPKAREKRRDVPLAAIPPRMVQAVLAIEDRRFYDHPGVDPIGTTRAAIDQLFGSQKYLRAAARSPSSWCKNTFLDARGEDAQAQAARVVHVDRARAAASKDEILELYLNDVSLGQRGSFAIHGVPEAARLFFGKDVSNVIAQRGGDDRRRDPVAVALSPFNNPDAVERAPQRRAAGDGRRRLHHAPTPQTAPSHEPLQSSPRALDAEAPYFVDYVGQKLQDKYPGRDRRGRRLHDARPAPAAARAGRGARRARPRRRAAGEAQAAAGAGGADRRSIRAPARSSRWSAAARTTSRSTTARSARAGSPDRCSSRSSTSPRSSAPPAEGRTDITPATVVIDEPTDVRRSTSRPGRRRTTRTSTTADHVAARAGALAQHRDDQGRRGGRLRQGRGALEAHRRRHAAAAVSVDRARRVRGDAVRDRDRLHAVPERRHAPAAPRDLRASSTAGAERADPGCRPPRSVARPDTTFLVTNMMRSVLNEGTGARRARGRLHARRRGQDRHDQRPARRLVRRLHAGAADGRLGRPRRQPAARPERRAGGAADLDAVHDARARRPRRACRSKRRRASCSSTSTATPASSRPRRARRIFQEAFLAGTEPTETCPLHGWS